MANAVGWIFGTLIGLAGGLVLGRATASPAAATQTGAGTWLRLKTDAAGNYTVPPGATIAIADPAGGVYNQIANSPSFGSVKPFAADPKNLPSDWPKDDETLPVPAPTWRLEATASSTLAGALTFTGGAGFALWQWVPAGQ